MGFEPVPLGVRARVRVVGEWIRRRVRRERHPRQRRVGQHPRRNLRQAVIRQSDELEAGERGHLRGKALVREAVSGEEELAHADAPTDGRGERLDLIVGEDEPTHRRRERRGGNLAHSVRLERQHVQAGHPPEHFGHDGEFAPEEEKDAEVDQAREGVRERGEGVLPQVEKLEGRERADRGGERGEAAARQVEAGQARGGQRAVLDGGEKASGALGRGLPGLEPGRGVRLVGCHGGRAEGAGAIDREVPMRTRCQRGADPARASEAKTTRRARMRDERRREDARAVRRARRAVRPPWLTPRLFCRRVTRDRADDDLTRSRLVANRNTSPTSASIRR